MANPEKENPYYLILDLLGNELKAFEIHLQRVLKEQSPYLSEHEINLYKKGKKLRPMLLLLSAKIGKYPDDGALEEKVIAAATSLELVHVGSLIHDDIVDKAPLRRGLPTISASRGYELAVIIGDLQWIQATRLMSEFMKTNADIELMRRFLTSGEQVCKGQLDEMLGEKVDNHQALLNRYYRTIDRKTGQLISFACYGGAKLVDAPPSIIGNLERFGQLLGRAFQVMDDVFDIVRPEDISGKSQLIDLAQGRLSLPIIYALEELPDLHFLTKISKGENLTQEELLEGAKIIRNGNGWIRAASDARAIVSKAQLILELLPKCACRDALYKLTDHLVNQGFLENFGS